VGQEGEEEEEEEEEEEGANRLGNGGWIAPEVHFGGVISERADCFSLALICWELVSGAAPFEPAKGEPGTEKDRLKKLVTTEDFRPPIPASVPASFAELLSEMWAAHPEARPHMSQVVQRMEGIFDQLLTSASKKLLSRE